MKQFWREVGLAVLMGMILPGIVLRIATYNAHQMTPETEPYEQQTEALNSNVFINVLTDEDTVERMELEEYLTGVVLGEMPAAFEKEALKAQAVVARTYTLRAHCGKSKHEEAPVCMDSACCQAYRAPERYLQSGGAEEDLNKIRNAVQETAGLVLTYGNELIEATYFSCSGGSTEDAVAVWGTDVPYLRATSSPGEENAAYYTDSVSFSPSQFAQLLSLEPTNGISEWFGPVTYTAGGGVATMEICGTAFKGTELRKLLGLRSTAFTIAITEDSIMIQTRGFGHRVGMSQYGADAMAASGCTFDEILAHYYQGTQLQKQED